MSDGKHGWLTGWGSLITGIATAGLVIVGYWNYAHPHQAPGQQSFSVPVNTGAESQESIGAARRTREAALSFEVKRCEIGAKLVSCSLAIVSPRYDRRLTIDYFRTRLIDSEGDSFQMTSDMVNLTLERDQKLAFKLVFAGNKDVVRPLTVKMVGAIDNASLDKGFEIK